MYIILYTMDMEGWTRSLVRTKDHKICRAYAAYSGLRVHGVYRMAMTQMLERENLEYIDGEIQPKNEMV